MVNNLGGMLKVLCVPGHSYLEDNERAIELAVSASLLAVSKQVQLACYWRLWRVKATFITQRTISPGEHRERKNCWTRRAQMQAAVYKECCSIGDHANKLSIPFNLQFRSCGEQKETVRFFLCDCQDPARTRMQALSKQLSKILEQISGCNLEKLRSSVNARDRLLKLC